MQAMAHSIMPDIQPQYDDARALWLEEYADGRPVPIACGKGFYQRVIAPKFFRTVKFLSESGLRER